ncbi:HNH endonuclease [Ferrithrix thermotolerans DSM 19514]|uniref:HNH endonuclease n=1 Tax=Ferrithrix thermotolerans DSM 19514 TaxID=1121881 RepID=A0A1M4XJ50_9ACTN|nr:HNH endonuclease signature motif containing protein [Ferrithrix thermotolerans]SHE93574.1 HNH endonuclease [Ferrithrix thermotolerans DSM 19514]
MCGLLYRPLLDAAHILPDSHPQGKPIVTNGLSLCKIHHAAYDLNYIGVRPDLVAVVRSDVMNTKDGPMLTYGLQAMNERQLIVPAKKSEIPDRNALEERFEEFKDIEKMSTSKDK